MEGWIKLYRILRKKAIWQCSTSDQKVILITILLMANHKEKEWEWMGKKFICKPGQLITSLPKLAKECGKGITIQKTRTALAKFERYRFLTDESTDTGRLITVVNWGFYQDNEKKLTDELAGHQQIPNKPLTPNKNDKNNKNGKTDREDIDTVSIAEPTGHSMSVCPSVNFDNVLQDVGRRYQEKIGIMSQRDEQKLAEWIQMGMSPSLVAEAIDIAAAKGNKRASFIVGILKNWYNDGHRDISALIAAEKDRDAKKQEQQKGKDQPAGMANAGAYRKVDPEAVKRWRDMYKDDYE